MASEGKGRNGKATVAGTHGPGSPWRPAIRIAGIYLAVGLVYIAISDQLVADLFETPDLEVAQTIKGFAFVVVTALLLVWLIVRTVVGQREAEAQYRLLFDESPDGIILAMPDGETLAANPAAGRLTGWSQEEMVASDRYLLFDRDDPAVAAYLAHRSRTGEFQGVLTMRRRDGERIPVEVSSRLFMLPGGGERACFFFRNISHRQRLEERLRGAERLQAVGQIAGGVAHEFNNLLTVVIGNLEAIADEAGPGGATRRNADEALQAAERGADLVSRLLAFARRQPLAPAPTDIAAVLEEFRPMLARVAGARMTLTVDTAPSLPPVEVDVGQLEIALFNLVANAGEAIEATGGSGRIDIAASLRRGVAIAEGGPAADYVVIAVSDSGPGMSAEVLRRAVEPFFTTKETGQGSGMGLSMVYGFAEQSGGRLLLESVEGEGTTASILLPVAGGRSGS